MSAPPDPPYWRDRPPPSDLERLGDERYVSLTTFEPDGTPVATPVRIVRDGDRLLVVWSSADLGTVERLRHTSRVTVTPSDGRGRPKRAWPLDAADPAASARVVTPVEGTARVLPDADEPRVRMLLAGKYRLGYRFTSAAETVLRLLRRHRPGSRVAVEITLQRPA